MATPHSGVRASPAATLGGKDGRSSAAAQRCVEGLEFRVYAALPFSLEDAK